MSLPGSSWVDARNTKRMPSPLTVIQYRGQAKTKFSTFHATTGRH